MSAALVALVVPGVRGQTALASHFGFNPGDRFGAAVAGIGDVNGDGVPDFIVGAPAEFGSASAPGYARVVSGANGAQIHRLLTTGEADRFGWSVAGVGDLTGDGVPDVLVGQPGSAPVSGEARLFSGLTGVLFGEVNGGSTDSWDGFGYAVAGAGDVDGDLVPDYVIGAPSLSGEGPGVARVYGGRDGGLLYTLTGLAAGDGFGAAVAVAGLIDDDTVPDLVVGTLDGGYARVHSGATGALLHHFGGLGAGFGRSVAGPGDIDGDGTDDIAVGAPSFDSVDVLSGTTGLLVRRYEALDGAFGASLAPLGDVDDDGVPDLLVGLPDGDVLEVPGCGSALIVSGDTGLQLFRFFGNAEGERTGAAVAVLGDTDGDGAAELLIGAPSESVPATGDVGAARSFPGALAGSLKPYGSGCPNSFLITPVVELLGQPSPGGDLTLSLSRLFPASAAVVLIGGGPGALPLNNGCILWLAPLLPTTLVFPLGKFPFGADTATVAGQLPPSVPVGQVLSFQAFAVDPDADGGFASTGAFQLTVQ